MNTVLWIAQLLLAAAFVGTGALKLAVPRAKLATFQPWVADFSGGAVRLIGVTEVLGALGLILPAVTGIATFLVPLAAVGLVLVMVGAAATHARRKEWSAIGANLVLILLAAFVAWGRFGPYPL